MRLVKKQLDFSEEIHPIFLQEKEVRALAHVDKTLINGIRKPGENRLSTLKQKLLLYG